MSNYNSEENKRIFNDFFSQPIVFVGDDPEIKGTHLKWWMEMFWGPMVYTEESTYNFINVYKTICGYEISDAIYVDQNPNRTPCGTLIPRKLKDKTDINYTGGGSDFLWDLHRKGYHLSKYHLSDEERAMIRNAPYSRNVNDAEYSSDAIQAKASHNDYLGGTAYEPCEPLTNAMFKAIPRDWLTGNALLKILEPRTLRLGRSSKSTAIDPHTECDQSVFWDAILYMYEGKEPIKGRHFVIYDQEPFDEYERVVGCMTDLWHMYRKKEWDLSKPAIKFQPHDGAVIYFNPYNPRFPHGVLPQESKEVVYSITSQCSLDDVPDYNMFNMMKKLAGRYWDGDWGEKQSTVSHEEIAKRLREGRTHD